ncbi:MAG TPA: class I tRNA ligase family protein, partial [Nitrososphaerales archaeon]|nr:class I tRNA ligase family protein [Nitrososphaerales archaeon]
MVTKFKRRSRPRETLSADYDWKKLETKVRDFYRDPATSSSIAKAVSRSRPVGYVDGPPTLNNQPHIGHVRGRMMKDLWYRYRTLEGENIVFRGGWDTQGLPVELQAEKEMGLSGDKVEDLRKVGVEKLVEACKQLIGKYKKDWEEADWLLGLMIDHEKAYMTYRDSYIEREWKYLEIAWKKGLLGEGFKVVPYCPKCQTALSAAEVSLGGYEQLEDPSLYFKARLADGSFLILWTTMPFTVVTDELVGVKPDSDYEYFKAGDETWVVCTGRVDALAKELGVEFGPTLKTVKGKDMEGLTYQHPLLEEIPGLNDARFKGRIHHVVAEDYVDVTTGTGLVHMSPANGEEDFAAAQRRGIPVFAPFDDQVKFTVDAGKFAGLFARDADEVVVESLREKGALLKAGRITHEYPVCWRSDDRLVWLARREYFYWVDRVRTQLVEAAASVDYFFEATRNRFLASVAEAPPWCITRERYWGTPLPIWACEKCGKKTGAFSRKRILELAVETPDGRDFELHRPWIDRVVLKCPSCGGWAVREPFVLDTWHNSGASPYASFTDAEFKRLVPVGFLTEGIDQTRGWAYTLLLLNVMLKGKPESPYKKFLFQGHVLDQNGVKMSKSLGNVIQGLDLLRNNSVDVLRLYILSKASPPDSVSLDLNEMGGRSYQVINTLYHLHLYLQQNGAVDGYDVARNSLAWATRRKLLTTVDKWMLSKLAAAENKVVESFGTAAFNEAAKSLEELVITHLSQTYIRLVRNELWKDDPKERGRRLAIYAVLGAGLKTSDVLLHPISPFATEFLYQEVFAGKSWKTPLLAIGRSKRAKGASPVAESIVDLALVSEEACNSARTKAKLKRRWPLRSAILLVPARRAKVASRARGTVALLCNVKEVTVVTSAAKFPARFLLRPNSSRVGALFKERTREVLAAVGPLEGGAALKAYLSSKPLKA